MSSVITGVSLFPWSTMQIANLTDAIMEIEESASVDRHGITIPAVFRIKFIGLWSAAAMALGASEFGLPIVGEYLGNLNSTMYVSHVDCKVENGSLTNPNGANGEVGIALYSATYSPLTAERYDLAPLDRPPLIEGGGIDLTEVRRVDQNGKPIINAAGDFYEGLPNFYIPGGECTITRNEANNPHATATNYSFSTNADNWFGVSPGQGLMGKITYKKVIEKFAGSDITYFTVTYPIRSRTDTNGWNYCPLNYGYRYKPKASQPAIPYVSGGVHGPVFLANDGTLLNPEGAAIPTAPIIFPAASGSTPAGYVTLKQQPWAALSLPSPDSL
jgi:hypothetical protein